MPWPKIGLKRQIASPIGSNPLGNSDIRSKCRRKLWQYMPSDLAELLCVLMGHQELYSKHSAEHMNAFSFTVPIATRNCPSHAIDSKGTPTFRIPRLHNAAI